MTRLRFAPLTPERWPDLQRLFGPKGACAGCWCMYWRLPRAQYERQKGDANRDALKALVAAGEPLGILAYRGEQPVGWCAVAPRESYPGLARSRTLRPIDEQPVWSVTCFFVARPERNKGVSIELLRAAAKYVKERGGETLEGYPVDPAKGRTADAFAWTGTMGAFREAGFEEAARPSATRAIMRLYLS